MPDPDPIVVVRARAYELADTGQYRGWDDIAAALTTEGFDERQINRLGNDALVKLMLKNRCERARD